MQNLYEILGIARTASNKEINAALRQLVRRYNEETAQGTRDSTEALRFINRARLTFADPERRAQYDAELAAHEAEQERIAAEQAAAEEAAAAIRAAAKAAENTTRLNYHPATKPAASSPTAPPAPAPPSAERPVTTPALILDEVTDPRTLDPTLIPIPMRSEPGRITFATASEGSKNVGYDLSPVLASREVAKKRSTAPRPLPRLAARFLDYGVWGVVLGLFLHHLSVAGTLSEGATTLLTSPFIAPVVITLSWALVEAVLLIFFPVTPGKFVLNIRVALNVSNPYAATDPGALIGASFSRAFRAWWRGMAGGLFPFYIFTLWRGRRKLLSFKETSWDFDGDCLVTHGRVPAPVALVVALLLVGGGWQCANQWATPFLNTLTTGWRYGTVAVAAVGEAWRVLSGELPTYAKKEIPPAPPKENRTVALEKEAQALTDKRNWRDLSEHCLAWTREEERNVSAWFCYGRARHELSDHATAMTALRRAALLAPQNDDIRRLIKEVSLVDMQRKQMRKRFEAETPKPEVDQ